jgi:hypothetical protein
LLDLVQPAAEDALALSTLYPWQHVRLTLVELRPSQPPPPRRLELRLGLLERRRVLL